MILMHLVRWPNELAKEVAIKSMIDMADICRLYPELAPYVGDYVFHPDDESENLIIDTACIRQVPNATLALFDDAGFRLNSTWNSNGNSGLILPARERACQVMARIKNIDLADASRVLDKEWDYIKRKKLQVNFETGEGLDEHGNAGKKIIH